VPLPLTFVTSAKRHEDLPDSPVEVAFVGRSNVGKSSLINALANRRQLAKVSNTPGRTQLLNMFTLPNEATVVDLPGYGYASVPGREKRTWQAMIEGYLLEREPLVLVFILVDGEIGPTKLDLQMLTWLQGNDVPYQIVATKLDKVKPSKLAGRRQQLARACYLDESDVMWVSASKGTGIDRLQAHVNSLLTSDR
jgi:GTP-binding protein